MHVGRVLDAVREQPVLERVGLPDRRLLQLCQRDCDGGSVHCSAQRLLARPILHGLAGVRIGLPGLGAGKPEAPDDVRRPESTSATSVQEVESCANNITALHISS